MLDVTAATSVRQCGKTFANIRRRVKCPGHGDRQNLSWAALVTFFFNFKL
jgi:hypothetical protein